jgi:histidyl-tRNA synthetase
MIFEHEIPSGSKLYFGESARVKREIEYVASEALDNLGFDEIVTPLFSYHQHKCFDEQKILVRVADEENHEVTLRADSTADVVRIVTKRLGRSTESKKWFYIQPTLASLQQNSIKLVQRLLMEVLKMWKKLQLHFLLKWTKHP